MSLQPGNKLPDAYRYEECRRLLRDGGPLRAGNNTWLLMKGLYTDPTIEVQLYWTVVAYIYRDKVVLAFGNSVPTITTCDRMNRVLAGIGVKVRRDEGKPITHPVSIRNKEFYFGDHRVSESLTVYGPSTSTPQQFHN